MKLSKLVMVFTVIFLMTFLSCNKEDTLEIQDESIALTTTSYALEASTEAAENVIDSYALYGGSYLDFNGLIGKGHHDRAGFFSDCTTIASETIDNITTVTIAFSEDCEDKKGNILSGSIVIVKTIGDNERNRTITFDGFSVNGYVMTGTKVCNFSSANTNGNPEMSGTVNMSIETDEGTVTKVGNRLVEITNGGDTDIHSDDEKTITGTHTFTNAEGNVYKVEITTALVKPVDCSYISSGVKQFTENNAISTLDYGDGTCDSIATLTDANGTVTEIEIKKRRRGRNL